MTEVQSKEVKYHEDGMMSNSPNDVKTNIRVSPEKYDLLKDIKQETGVPINALIVEGIDLVLLKYEDELLEAVRKAAKKAGNVESVLSSIKKQ